MKYLRQYRRFFLSPAIRALWLLVLSLVATGAVARFTALARQVGKQTVSRATAKETFERLKKLEGRWTGRSTKGWAEAITFKTIAQGSVVHESSFEARPSEAMATMYYLDGQRLLLTHYCVSKTQPRLQATAFDEVGRKVTFTFLDGGNLPSRDRGHMDKAVYHFLDNNHFTVRWTWYQDGKEQWLEEIKYERM